MPKLKNGDLFPHIEVSTIADGSLSLPADLKGHLGVVLFYRGSWCPYCNAQLAAFVRAQEQLAELDIKVVALSVDDEATSRSTADKRRIGFPLGYGADAWKDTENLVARLLGGPLADKRDLAKVASPVGHVAKGDAPFLIVHGDADETVPVRQSEEFADALRKAGVPVTFIPVPGAGHNLATALRANPLIAMRVATFFADHLKKPVTTQPVAK